MEVVELQQEVARLEVEHMDRKEKLVGENKKNYVEKVVVTKEAAENVDEFENEVENEGEKVEELVTDEVEKVVCPWYETGYSAPPPFKPRAHTTSSPPPTTSPPPSFFSLPPPPFSIPHFIPLPYFPSGFEQPCHISPLSSSHFFSPPLFSSLPLPFSPLQPLLTPPFFSPPMPPLLSPYHSFPPPPPFNPSVPPPLLLPHLPLPPPSKPRRRSPLTLRREGRGGVWGRLPEEVRLAILALLPPSALCAAALVSRAWHRLATDPGLWRAAPIRLTDATWPHLGRVLATPRLARATAMEVDLQEARPTDHDLRLIQTRRLDTLNFGKTDLLLVRPAVLAATVLAVERTDLRHYDPDVLFPMMAAAQSRLTRLPIVRMGTNTAAFSRAIVKLEDINLPFMFESNAHVDALFQTLATEETNVKKVNAVSPHIKKLNIEPETLAAALHSVPRVTVGTMLPQQMDAFMAFPSARSRITDLYIMGNFSSTPAARFAAVLGRVTTVDLVGNKTITAEQVGALLAVPDSAIRSLVLSYTIDLSAIDSKVLAKGIGRLHKIHLNKDNNLSREQVVELFATLDSTSALTSLNLSQTDLSLVPAVTFSRVVNRLDSARFRRSRLTCAQMEALLVVPSTKLRLLNLKGSFLLPNSVVDVAKKNIKRFIYGELQQDLGS